MSTLQKINFTPVTSILDVNRRDLPIADPTLVNPLNSIVLCDGEWVTINTSYQLVRATSDVAAPAGGYAAVRSFPVFVERGRYDVQSMSQHKVTFLFGGFYEFDTRIFDAAATVHAGVAITFIMQPVKVATVSFSGRAYSGLVGHGGVGSDTDPIVGYVTRLPSSNGGQLRFMTGYAQ
jgi:hypothetical protein